MISRDCVDTLLEGVDGGKVSAVELGGSQWGVTKASLVSRALQDAWYCIVIVAGRALWLLAHGTLCRKRSYKLSKLFILGLETDEEVAANLETEPARGHTRCDLE